jgi:transposase
MSQRKKSRASRNLSPVHSAAAAIDIGATNACCSCRCGSRRTTGADVPHFYEDLQRLADWFTSCGIRTIVMESTGICWIPVFEILEQRGFEVMVVNARDAKHVPGRKTDVSDAQ